MRRLLLSAVAVAGLIATPALAALKVGAVAPDFQAQATLGGQIYPFALADALKKGPVVLYFFPAAFTAGCTAEAHEFADAMDSYKAAGATVIGMTAGNVDRLAEFSVSECRSKFPVAAATPAVLKAYDSRFLLRPGWSDRTSYVITPDGKIAFVHSGLNPVGHVADTLKAVQAYKATH